MNRSASPFKKCLEPLREQGVEITPEITGSVTASAICRPMVSEYKKRNVLVSLHSDGCVAPALDSIAELGYDFIHPWQENCSMPYSLYLEKYQNKFGILGGVCIQSTLDFGDYERLESEIRRVFSLLKGKRWACCTTHFVQDHCSIEKLTFAYDLIRKLAE